MQKKLWLTAWLALLLMPFTAWSQDVPRADVKIDAVMVTEETNNTLRCKVKVSNAGDDHSYGTRVVILLPGSVRVQTVSAGCIRGTVYQDGGNQSHGVVTCRLGQMAVNENRTVQVKAVRLPNNTSKKFGALAWSTTPDHHPENNHLEGEP